MTTEAKPFTEHETYAVAMRLYDALLWGMTAYDREHFLKRIEEAYPFETASIRCGRGKPAMPGTEPEDVPCQKCGATGYGKLCPSCE